MIYILLILSTIVFPAFSSSVPILENLEKAPPKKYSERYIRKIENALQRKDQKIRVVTYNILFDVFDDQLEDKTYSWPERLPGIVQSIQNMQPDILGVQEDYPSQLQDLMQSLEKTYDCYAGDNITGEYNAIFFNKDRFEIILRDSMEMPLHPSDDKIVAKIPGFLPPELEPGRRLTLVQLRDKLTDQRFAVLNTHLTWYRVNSREEDAYFIVELVERLHASDIPVILMGDFNTFPNRPEKADQRYFDGSHICQIFQSALNDAKHVALLGHVGPLATFAFKYLGRGNTPLLETENPDVVLDHIYVSPSVGVIAHATESAQANGRYPSDHLPVIADVLLPE